MSSPQIISEPTAPKRWKFGYAEILVFLVIFLVLLILLVAVIFEALFANSASKNKATSVAVKTALESYLSDYGTLLVPKNAVPFANGDTALGARTGKDPTLPPLPGTDQFFQALSGNVNTYNSESISESVTGANPRNVPYLTLQKSSVDADGIVIQSMWFTGKPAYFGIELDTNYDGKLEDLPDPSSGTFTAKAKDSAAIWSNNGQPYTKPDTRWSTTY